MKYPKGLTDEEFAKLDRAIQERNREYLFGEFLPNRWSIFLWVQIGLIIACATVAFFLL